MAKSTTTSVKPDGACDCSLLPLNLSAKMYWVDVHNHFCHGSDYCENTNKFNKNDFLVMFLRNHCLPVFVCKCWCYILGYCKQLYPLTFFLFIIHMLQLLKSSCTPESLINKCVRSRALFVKKNQHPAPSRSLVHACTILSELKQWKREWNRSLPRYFINSTVFSLCVHYSSSVYSDTDWLLYEVILFRFRQIIVITLTTY